MRPTPGSGTPLFDAAGFEVRRGGFHHRHAFRRGALLQAGLVVGQLLGKLGLGRVHRVVMVAGLQGQRRSPPVTASTKPAITTIRPAVSAGVGTWPSTGQAISAARPGAKAGKIAARDGPSSDTILA